MVDSKDFSNRVDALFAATNYSPSVFYHDQKEQVGPRAIGLTERGIPLIRAWFGELRELLGYDSRNYLLPQRVATIELNPHDGEIGKVWQLYQNDRHLPRKLLQIARQLAALYGAEVFVVPQTRKSSSDKNPVKVSSKNSVLAELGDIVNDAQAPSGLRR